MEIHGGWKESSPSTWIKAWGGHHERDDREQEAEGEALLAVVVGSAEGHDGETP